jgi:hypothetical protein
MKFNTVKIESGMDGFTYEKDFVRLEIEGRFKHREVPALVKAAPELAEALEALIKRAEKYLDQSANMEGLENCDALAKARAALSKAKEAA